MTDTVIIILAGGLGKRMESSLPKVLHEINNTPMLISVIFEAIKINPIMIYIVVGKFRTEIFDKINQFNLTNYVCLVDQIDPQGTGHAVQQVIPFLSLYNPLSNIVILSGDVPLIKASTILKMLQSNEPVKLLVASFDNPYGYGRIITENNSFIEIIEEKDCNIDQKLIKFINGGIYSIQNGYLTDNIFKLTNKNSQNEFYLTDVIKIIKNNENCQIGLCYLNSNSNYQIMGVNTKDQLKKLQADFSC